MKTRLTGRLVLGSLIALGAAAAAFACSFPDVTFTGEVGGEGGAGGEDGAIADAGPGVTDGPTLFADAFVAQDATIANDDAGRVDAAGCTTCDCDTDNAERAGTGCNTGGQVPDCDDTDSRANPSMDYRFDDAEAPLFGNWNCVDGVQKLERANFRCSDVALNACPNARGFENDPACGAGSLLIGCKIVTRGIFPLQTTTCEKDPALTDAGRQACK